MTETPVTPAGARREGGAEETVEQWLPLVQWVINRALPEHVHQRIDHEDAFQVGVIALIGAIRLYDPSRGAIFKTYAANRIKWHILMAAGLTSKGWRPFEASLDELTSAGTPVSETMAAPDDRDIATELDVQRAFDALPPRLRTVAELFWRENLTKAEVGARLGVTRERGRQLVNETNERLRALITSEALA